MISLGVLMPAVLIGMLASFVVMNPLGFMNVLATGGAFMISSLVGIVNMGFAGIWWLAQAAFAGIVNILVGLGNAILTSISNVFGVSIPLWPYIQAPDMSPTFANIMAQLGEQASAIQTAIHQYVNGVQQGAPSTYAAGGVAGIATSAAAAATSKIKATGGRPGGWTFHKFR